MIKKTVFSGAAIASALIVQSSNAADLPSYKAPPVSAPPAPVFTWTGFYIGFNHGFGGGVADANLIVGAPPVVIRSSDRASGWLGGGQLGYNFQFANNIVLGLETDMQWSDIRTSHQGVTGPFSSANIQNNLDWFGTTRARVGYSFGRLLPYVTGGVAYGQLDARWLQFIGGLAISGSAADTRVGWTVGAGVEYALTDALSATAEYLYLELPGVSGPVTTAPVPFFGSLSTSSFGTHIVRTGMNLKLGGFNTLLAGDGLLGLFTAAPETDWSGFYVGINGGYGGDRTNSTLVLASPVAAATANASNRTGGAIVGGQLGYNYHFSQHIVLGLETDGQWSEIQAWHRLTTAAVPIFAEVQNRLDWFGTTRVRLGWASGSALAYLTGGVAYGGLSAHGTEIFGPIAFQGSASETKVGWTAGAGMEYALSSNLSLKTEYLYVQLDGIRGPAFGAPALAGVFSTGTFGAHITRVGLNWRFGGFGAAPVVAQY